MLNHVVRQKAEGQAPSVSSQSVDIRVTYKTGGVSLTKKISLAKLIQAISRKFRPRRLATS